MCLDVSSRSGLERRCWIPLFWLLTALWMHLGARQLLIVCLLRVTAVEDQAVQAAVIEAVY